MRSSNMRRIVYVAVIALLCGAYTPAASAGDLFRGPYLQMAAPDSVVVVWRTEGASQPVLRYGPSPNALDSELSGDAILLRVSHDVEAPESVPRLYKQPADEAAERDEREQDPSTSPNTYQYEARVMGLTPGTKYYYAVYDGGTRLAGGDADHYFVASPPHGSEAQQRIWVVGDSGTGGTMQARVHDAMIDFVADTGRPLDQFIHVGDMAYGSGTDPEFQRRFFEMYQPTLRNTVCWPTMGNHEGKTSRGISGFGPYYDAYVVPTEAEVGGVASGTEAYYSFRIANIHFICLDSHDLDRKPTGAMAQWLRADLEKADADWLVAFWHHPPYSKGSHDSDVEGQLIEMREHIMPILEGGGVDLVLTGHSHIYERSMLMDGAYTTPTTAHGVILDDGDGNPDGDGAYRKSGGLNPHEGTVQIVAGHGGTGLGRSGTMPVMREIILDHGSVILDFDGDTLMGTMVDKDNVRRDVFSIVKRGEVDQAPIQDPWQPVHDLSQMTDIVLTFAIDPVGAPPPSWHIAAGDNSGVTVQARENLPIRRLLNVKAKDDSETTIVYEGFTEDVFEFDAYYIFRAEAGQEAGVIFGYENAENHYRLVTSGSDGVVKLIYVEGGESEVVSEQPVELEPGEIVHVTVTTRGHVVAIEVEGKTEFTARLPKAMPEGQFGLVVAPGSEADFAYFSIERDL
jgi:hypothetical protein